jgi:hypothetical protein
MATQISSLQNNSNTPVAYLGTDSSKPTKWAAWGFAPNASANFGWTVETTKGHQALLTQAGVFYIWDNGNWTILYQKAGSTVEGVLIEVHGPGNPNIILTVGADGSPSATQP